MTSIPDGILAVLGSMESDVHSRPTLGHVAAYVIGVGRGTVQISLLLSLFQLFYRRKRC